MGTSAIYLVNSLIFRSDLVRQFLESDLEVKRHPDQHLSVYKNTLPPDKLLIETK